MSSLKNEINQWGDDEAACVRWSYQYGTAKKQRDQWGREFWTGKRNASKPETIQSMSQCARLNATTRVFSQLRGSAKAELRSRYGINNYDDRLLSAGRA